MHRIRYSNPNILTSPCTVLLDRSHCSPLSRKGGSASLADAMRGADKWISSFDRDFAAEVWRIQFQKRKEL
jgi:hypothetical protein